MCVENNSLAALTKKEQHIIC